MTQPQDGGEAILEAFRNLNIDYIISSPGSEWAPVWDALARQKVNGIAGPTYINCWHETLAMDMALGYTRVTGKLQAVLLHAGVGLLQGSVGIHSAYQGEVPVLICSGEANSYGENPELDPQGQWYRNLSVVGGPNTFVEPFVKWSGQATSPYTLYEQLVRAGEMAQRVPKGPTFLYNPVTQSFGVAGEANLPFLTIVFNNGNYEAMRRNHLHYYPSGDSAKSDTWYGVHIAGPNYAQLVEPFGGYGERVEDPTKLKQALQNALDALQEGRLALVDVVLDK